MKRKLLLLTFALPVLMCQNALAQSSRLVAESHWRNNGAAFKPVDSSDFNYSGTRSGDLNNTMKYDNSTTMTFMDDSAVNAWRYLQTFDSANNITTYESQYWDTTIGWIPSTKDLYTYNALNQITTMIAQTWNGAMWVPVTENVFSYDSGHVLYSNLLQTWNSFTLNWDHASQKTYYFDGLHRLVNQTDQVFIAGVPNFTIQHGYTYTAGSLLSTTSVSEWNGAGWSYDSLYTNGFDSSGNIVTTLGQTYNGSSSVWLNQTLHLFSNFIPGTHIPRSEVYQTWDSVGSGNWDNVMQYTYTFNSNNQLTRSVGTSWNVVGIFEFAVNDPLNRYYYAPAITEVKSVKGIVTSGGEANIYPVPAQNMLHVDLNWDVAQSAKISIYDAVGNVVNQWQSPVGNQYKSAVSVNDLAAGVYFVKINGTQGQIVKQIVIAH